MSEEENDHCPGCGDPSMYAARGCPGIDAPLDRMRLAMPPGVEMVARDCSEAVDGDPPCPRHDDEGRERRPGWTHGRDRDGGTRTIYRDGESVGQMLSGDAIAMIDALRGASAKEATYSRAELDAALEGCRVTTEDATTDDVCRRISARLTRLSREMREARDEYASDALEAAAGDVLDGEWRRNR